MKNAVANKKNTEAQKSAKRVRVDKNAVAQNTVAQNTEAQNTEAKREVTTREAIAERAKTMTVDALNAMQNAERLAYTEREVINLLCCEAIKNAIDSDKYIARYHASFAKAKSEKVDYIHIVSTSAVNVTLLQIKFDSAYKCHINTTASAVYRTEEMQKRFAEAKFHFNKCYKTEVIDYTEAIERALNALAILNSI